MASQLLHLHPTNVNIRDTRTSSSRRNNPSSSSSKSTLFSPFIPNHPFSNSSSNGGGGVRRISKNFRLVVVGSTTSSSSSRQWWEWEKLKKQLLPSPPPSKVLCVSDVLWPSLGAFVAMALLGRLDRMVAAKGLSFTIAPLGAVCAVLFAAPNSPAAQKYNMFLAQIVCAALGVLALSILGPGSLARATAVSASIAFMIITGATHPPAASLPILFIDGAKFHHLNLWYALFPGATSCVLLCVIQEMVIHLKNNYKF